MFVNISNKTIHSDISIPVFFEVVILKFATLLLPILFDVFRLQECKRKLIQIKITTNLCIILS